MRHIQKQYVAAEPQATHPGVDKMAQILHFDACPHPQLQDSIQDSHHDYVINGIEKAEKRSVTTGLSTAYHAR